MAEFGFAGERVTCADCGAEFVCTPATDYYHRPVTPRPWTAFNGVCEACLLGGRRLIHIDPRSN